MKQHDVSATFSGSDMVVDYGGALVDGGTLGMLVQMLMSSFVISEEMHVAKELREALEDARSEPPDGRSAFRTRFHISMSNDRYALLKKDLKSLVRMRNYLVHQFASRHDTMTPEGCRIALATLDKALRRTRRHIDDLRDWADDLTRSRKSSAEYLLSPEYHDLWVHGRIPWQHTKIVDALRHAAVELSVDGWTLLSKAAEWFTTRYPHESPEDYNCRSWRQLLHECQFCELRYFEANGKRAAYYREKVAGT